MHIQVWKHSRLAIALNGCSQTLYIFRLIHEIQTTNQVKVLERRLLEKSWDASLKEKKHIAYDSNDAGLLLHEQCDKYKR